MKTYVRPTVVAIRANPHKMGTCCFVKTYKTQ